MKFPIISKHLINKTIFVCITNGSIIVIYIFN